MLPRRAPIARAPAMVAVVLVEAAALGWLALALVLVLGVLGLGDA